MREEAMEDPNWTWAQKYNEQVRVANQWMGMALQKDHELKHMDARQNGLQEMIRCQAVALTEMLKTLEAYRSAAGSTDDNANVYAIRFVKSALVDLRSERDKLRAQAQVKPSGFWFRKYQELRKRFNA